MKQIDRPVWTYEEAAAFFSYLSSSDVYWHTVCSLAIMTGLRAGELYALTWDDINFETRVIRVCKAYNHKQRTILPYTKTRKIRWVPINAQLEDTLLKCPRREDNFVLSRCPTFNNGEQSNKTKELALKAHVPPIRFHDFRALFASKVLMSGVPMVSVMSMCGWSQLATAQRYLRLSGRDVVGLTDKVEFFK